VYDLLVRGARLVDGTGNPWTRGDVAVAGDSIAAVGRVGLADASRVIDGDGLVVCPGFIDLHAHSDLQLFVDPSHAPKVRQGITTEVIGQDGLSYAPIRPDVLPVMRDLVAGINGAPDISYDWATVAQFLDRLDGVGPAVNVLHLVPHGALRLSVLGMEPRAPSGAELARMQEMAAAGMADGAFGLSTGLTYAPAQWSDTHEIVALCRSIASYEGVYVTHHRDYGARLVESVDEALQIGRDAGVAVHFSHFHISGSPWRGRAAEFLSRIDAERADGRDITLDAYPYLAGSTFLAAWLPESAQAGTPAEVMARLRDAEQRARIVSELNGGPRTYVVCTWEDFQIAGVRTEQNRSAEGRRLPELAAARAVSVGDLIVDLLLEEEMEVSILAFVGNEDNVREIMRHPVYTVGTDGILVGGAPHPRAYGTFPKLLGEYVRDLQLMSLEEAVRKMTSAAAQRMGIRDRGLLRTGMKADLVVFEPAAVGSPATYADPKRFPTGIPYVLVNGTPVVWDGRHTGATPGRVLRRGR
jgi:N-acyl-D-amino-acid deacylase